MFVSYARNIEDVVSWQAPSYIELDSYVDVGV